MYSGKLYRCKTITLSRTNIDLGHRGQIVLFFALCPKSMLVREIVLFFCSCNSRFWKINIRPRNWFSQFRGLCLFSNLLNSSRRGPCMMLYRSLTEGLVEILVRSSFGGFCMKILQMTFPRGACMKAIVGGSWEVPVSRSCKIRSLSTVLWRSYRGSGLKILVTAFYRPLWKDLVEILVKCRQTFA